MKINIPFTDRAISITRQKNKLLPDVKVAPKALAYNPLGVQNYRDTYGQHIDVKVFYWLYRQQSDLAACVNYIQKNVGLEGYEFYSTDDEPVNDQIVEQVSQMLNFDQSFNNFKNVMVRDYLLAGNGYGVFVDNLAETEKVGITTIDPRTMAIVIDQYGQIIRYVQKVPPKEAVMFEPSEILHFTIEKDPDNEVFGYPKMTPAILEALTDIEARNLNMAFFRNDARPSTIYVLDDGMNEEEQKTALQEIRNVFGGGGANKKKSAAIAGVKEIKTIGATQTEMEFMQQRKFSIEKLSATFGIPKFLLGYTESVNNNNGVELTKNTTKKEIFPIENAFMYCLNKGLCMNVEGYEESNTRVRFKKQILETAGEIEERAIKMKEAGIMTTREAKQFIGHELTPEMEQQENIDAFILKSGTSSALIQDVGVDPVMDMQDPELAQNFVKEIQRVTNDTD